MGVPKFYRWLSERYPCINENVNQYNVPEFDNFYVDMNGVFHICSHPSDDIHFRIPESQIFENIAIYVNFLFHLIQPRKVFFLSVDGVAPRSKMNQQRSRRFKTAKEAIEKEARAKQMGETLPDDPRFDSNCITPGTEFMKKLHLFMIEFLAKKIQNYQEWREIEIIYSGYDVPGEGEHKIMDYIRYCKTKNIFSPDTRHCLYGLDADLINLGLSTHEPYFSLLREEVSFNKSRQKHCDPTRTNFQLLHLSILRRYIYHEFQELENKIKFSFNLEKIIDDWILVNFLVGNDFLPHVPKFHINKNGIQILYDTYKAVLPKLDGYLNDSGTLSLKRYQKFLAKLSEYDLDLFNQNNMDLKYLDNVNDITFGCGVDLSEDFDFNKIHEEDSLLSDTFDESSEDSSSENELDDEFTMHKNHYYVTKLEFKDLSTDVPKIVFEYIKGIQWVLHYYFDGCMSWNWYYPYHYGPYVSDLAKIDPSEEFQFEMGTPYQPLVQLLAVLPQASKEILPKAFQKLTYIPDSPLIEYFPKEFKTDLNEKIHDYEAIILIPFMDDKLLMKTFEQYKNALTSDEVDRNTFGYHHLMKYSENIIKNSNEILDVSRFSNVLDQKIPLNQYILPREIIYKGVRQNVDLNAINGFPSFNGIDYTIKMEMARIKVFEFSSQNPTMMIEVKKKCYTPEILHNMAKNYINKIVYINWPTMSEVKLIELLDDRHRYLKGKKIYITPEKLRNAEISCRNHCVMMKNRRGVVLESVEQMAKVVPLQSQRYIITSKKLELHKEWSKTPQYVPIDLVVFEVPMNQRRQTLIYKSLQSIFTKNKSLYLITNPYYGYKASIIKYISQENSVVANVCVTSEPDFKEIEVENEYILRKNYYIEKKIAVIIKRQLNMPESIIRRLFGSVLTQYETNKGRIKRINIGLKLKYKNNFQQYCVPGYSYVDMDDIFYNKKVIQLFTEYHERFPQVFEMLRDHKTSYELNDMFPDEEISKSAKIKALNEIKNWKDSQEFSKIPHTLADANYLDNCIVKAVEERIESHMVLMNEENTFNHKCHPSSFYIPEFILKGNHLPDPKVKFQLFDRVVNVKTLFVVPFGLKGTVIGIYYGNDQLNKDKQNSSDETDEKSLLSSTIEVMFDEPFEGGLYGRSSKNNVFIMHASWLINISYGLRISKKSVNFKNVYHSIQPCHNRSQSSNYNNYNNQHVHYNESSVMNSKVNYRTNFQNQNVSRAQMMEKNEHNESNKFNHSENSPFKALAKPSYASIVGGSQMLNDKIPTKVKSPDNSYTNVLLTEDGQTKKSIKNHSPKNEKSTRTESLTINLNDISLLPPPPFEWIMSSKQHKKCQSDTVKIENLNKHFPMPPFTILPVHNTTYDSSKTSENNLSGVNIKNKKNQFHQQTSSLMTSNNHSQEYNQSNNHNHYQNESNSQYKNNLDIQHGNGHQNRNRDRIYAGNYYKDHNFQNRLGTTLFVPLVVARNYQYENVLRRRNNRKD